MDQVQQDKLVANIKASPKMLSVQLTAFFGVVGAGLAAVLATIPLDQQISIVTSVLSRFGWGIVLIPIVGAVLRWYARVHPQTNLTPLESEAKSAETGPAEAQQIATTGSIAPPPPPPIPPS